MTLSELEQKYLNKEVEVISEDGLYDASYGEYGIALTIGCRSK